MGKKRSRRKEFKTGVDEENPTALHEQIESKEMKQIHTHEMDANFVITWQYLSKKSCSMKLVYKDGAVYTGCAILTLNKAQRHGQGILTTKDGDVLEGHWTHDQFHGCVNQVA